jgi:hypothetical protein
MTPRLNLPALTKAYLFANTPSYLYSRFRADDSVRNLGTTSTPDELAQQFRERMNKSERSLEDAVIGYAVLVAVTFMTFADATSAFARIDIRRAEWGPQLKALYESSRLATMYITAEARVNPVQAPRDMVRSASSSSQIAASPIEHN